MKDKTIFKKGFMTIKRGTGPIYIAIHSGPNFGAIVDRDSGSDVVSTMCWRKTGGVLVLPGIPRQQYIGIDFNRGDTNQKTSVSKFSADRKTRFKFAWMVGDAKDYAERREIYKNFWGEVKNLANSFLIMHTLDSRIGNFPSIMDIITFEGRGVNKNSLEKAVKKANKKYRPVFRELRALYNKAILLKHEMGASERSEKWGSYIYEELFERDVNNIKHYLKGFEASGPKDRLFIGAIKNVLKMDILPEITIEKNTFWREVRWPQRACSW